MLDHITLEWTEDEIKENEINQAFNDKHSLLRSTINRKLMHKFGSGVFVGVIFEVVKMYPNVRIVGKFMSFFTEVRITRELIAEANFDITDWICEEFCYNISLVLKEREL